MKNNIKISIIIPIYNMQNYLKKCIESLLKQTLKEFEVICIDDGSTDNSLEIINSYIAKDKRIKLISQQNQGQGVARNNGIDIAQGEYLVFLDPDDWLNEYALEKIYKKFEDTSCQIVQFNFASVNEETYKIQDKINFFKIINNRNNKILEEKDIIHWKELPNNIFSILGYMAWTRAYKTSFVKNNKIKFSNTKRGEDQLFTIHAILKASKITFIDDYLYLYLLRKGSASRHQSNEAANIFQVINDIENMLSEENLINELEEEFTKYKIDILAIHARAVPTNKMQNFLKESKKYLDESSFKKMYDLAIYKKNFLQKLFSIKNIYVDYSKHKLVTLLGAEFIIKK